MMAVGGAFSGGCGCGPDIAACESPTQPVATVGVCLADGTPIAVTVVRDCVGTVTSEGWINLTTGAYSAGAPPVGTMACGDSRSITTTGTFCDVAEDGAVLGLVLVEYQYAADGSISSVRLVDAVTGDTYTPTGTVTTCPAGVAHPERDMLQLCDTNDDESGTVLTVSFLRDFARDETGAVVGHSDYALDGEPYTPSGTVGVCPAESECRNCQTFTLCDTPADATPAPVLASGTGAQTGTAANGVGWSTSSGTSSSVPDWFPLSMFPVTAGGPFVLTLDRPSAVIWSARVGTNGTAVGRLIMPPGSELVALSPLHVYDASTRTLSPVPGAGTADGNGESTFTHLGPVTSLTIESDGTTGLNISQRSVGAFLLTPATVPFLRTTCRDCTGLVLDATDTLLDGTTPYTPIGTVGVCQPQQAEPCRDTATLLLCDEASDLVWNQISVDADPDSPAGQGWLFRLSPNDAPSTIATVRVTTSTPDTGSCASNGPRWYNNGTVFVYELDEVAQTFPTLRVNVLDFDTGETLTMLEGSPDRLEGNAYTTGGGVIRSNENNATGYLLFDGPPATFSYRFNGSCTNIAFDAVSARTTQFIRRIVTDCDTDETVSVTDTDLQGQPYTPTGEVGQCETTGGGSSECATCETLTLCDVVPDESPGGPDISWEAIDLAALADGPTSGTLANRVGWTVSCGHWLGPQGHYTIYPASGGGTPACDQTWTFDQPVYARVGLRGFNVGPSECLSWSSEGEFTVEFLHPNHEVSSAPNTICGLGGAVDESLIVSSAPVSEVTLSAINNPGQGRGIGLMEVGLLNEPPAPGTAVPFLRTVCRDCSGAVTSTTDTTLDGAPYTPAGTVTTCGSSGGGSTPVEPEPCRGTSSTLLCDTAATDAITVFDPANVAGSDGWEVVSFTGANAGSGPETAMPYPAPNGSPFAYPAFGARTDQNAGAGGSWTGYDAAPVRWVLRKMFTAPEDGVAVAESAGFRGDGGARVRINGVDAGMYGQWNQPATSGTAQIPVTAGPNTVEIEVRDTSGINNVRGRLDIAMPRTVQFMRRQTVDCETGEVIATHDTTLDGEPYTVTGEVGQCAPVAECCEQAPPEQRVDVETELLCIRDEDSGDVLGQVVVERVYDDQSGDRLEQRLTDPTSGEPVELPAGAILAKCPSPDRITRQICVVESGAAEFLTNAANATSGQDTDWQWSPVLGGSWYPMYRVAPNPLWTVQDTASNQAHWVSPHASKSVCSPNVPTAPNVTATWFTRASWNLPANVSPDSIRIAASVLNADNRVVQWRLNDGPWQPVAGGELDPPAWTITPSAVPGGRAGQNEIVVQITETQPAVNCPSPNQAGMILHVAATYDYEPRVWTQVIEEGGRVYYLDENGDRQDAIPDGQRVVACGGGGDSPCCPPEARVDVEPDVMCIRDADGEITRQVLVERVYDDQSGIRTEQRLIDPTTGDEVELPDGAELVLCQQGPQEGRDVELLPMCVLDNATGGSIQRILAEVSYDTATGERLGVAYVDPETWGPVAMPGGTHIGLCPETDEPEPTPNVEVIQLCDLAEGVAPVPFLRHIAYLAGATVPVVTDTALDGVTPYTVVGEVGQCSPEPEACRNTSSLLLCDLEDPPPGSETPVLLDDATPHRTSAVPGLARRAGGGQALWDGGTLAFTADANGSAGDGTQVNRWVNATVTAPASACDDGTGRATVTVSVDLTPDDWACGGYGFFGLYGPQGAIANTGVGLGGGTPTAAGTTLSRTVTGEVSAADLSAGRIVVWLNLRTYISNVTSQSNGQGGQCTTLANGPLGWTAQNLTVDVVQHQADACETQFLRHVTVDCETGAVVSTTDTTLDGDPYTVAGTVAQCRAAGGECCPLPEPEPRPVTVLEECRWDDTDGDGVGDVQYVELIGVDSDGTLTPIGTYVPDLSAPYTPVAPVADGPVEGAPAVQAVQAHRLEVPAGGSWSAGSVALLQSVTAVAHGGPAQITTADGVSPLYEGESVTWSVVRDGDAMVVGPLDIAATAGTVTVTYTRGVTA